MKKLILIGLTLIITACTSGISAQDMANRMPDTTDERQSVIFNAPSTGSFSSDAIYVAKLKVLGSEQADKLMKVLSLDNVNIGISGKNPVVSKAILIYSLEKAPKIGKNIELYVANSLDSKDEIEKLSKDKNIKLHYFIQQ